MSIRHEAFLAEDMPYTYETIDGAVSTDAPVFACHTKIDTKKFSIINASFKSPPTSADQSEEFEDFIVVKLEGQPAYGCALIGSDNFYWSGFIAVEIKPKVWIPANVFIQATFLAGLEQLKELAGQYEKIDDLTEMYALLEEFIAFREKTEEKGS